MKLSRRQTVVVGIYTDKGSIRETARVLGISRRAARTHLRRAVLKLREMGEERAQQLLQAINNEEIDDAT